MEREKGGSPNTPIFIGSSLSPSPIVTPSSTNTLIALNTPSGGSPVNSNKNIVNPKKCPKNMVQHWKFKPQAQGEITLVKPPNYSRRPRRHSSPSIDNFVHHWKFDPKPAQIATTYITPPPPPAPAPAPAPAIAIAAVDENRQGSTASEIKEPPRPISPVPQQTLPPLARNHPSERRHTFFPYLPGGVRRQSLPNYLIEKKGRKSLPNILERQGNLPYTSSSTTTSLFPPSLSSLSENFPVGFSDMVSGTIEDLTPPDYYYKTRFTLPPMNNGLEEKKIETTTTQDSAKLPSLTELLEKDSLSDDDGGSPKEDPKVIPVGKPKAMSISYLLSDVNISEPDGMEEEQEAPKLMSIQNLVFTDQQFNS